MNIRQQASLVLSFLILGEFCSSEKAQAAEDPRVQDSLSNHKVGSISTARTKSSIRHFQKMEFDSKRIAEAARLKSILSLEGTGKFSDANREFISLLADPKCIDERRIRLAYAKMLVKWGHNTEALQQVEPLIFTSSNSAVFEAVDLYDEGIRKLKGRQTQLEFRRKIHDLSLNGNSIHYYNGIGLNDDQAMNYIRGGFLQGKGDYIGAEKEYRKILPSHPPCMQFYSNVADVLFALKRPKEVTPIFNEWYLHSNLDTRAKIRKTCDLDFKHLDQTLKP
jgi:hypothetical protein